MYLRINEQRVNINISGQGDEIVVALHGVMGSPTEWRSVSENTDGVCRVVAPDLASDESSSGDPVLKDTAMLISLLRKLSGRQVHLVGHDYGGAIAMLAARSLRVRSMTLIEPSAFWLLNNDYQSDRACYEEITELSMRINRSLTVGSGVNGMRDLVDYCAGEESWLSMDEEARHALRQRAGRVQQQINGLLAIPIECTASQIQTPTQLLYGENTRQPWLRLADKLFLQIPQCSMRMVPQAGHMLAVTHSKIVSSHLRRHMRMNDPAPLSLTA